jgi:eukaryotic-like serine/threonine-protein kinase
MTQAPASHSSTLPATAAEAVDQVCDRFEAAWQAGQNPHIEEYLRSADGPARSVLLRQLLMLELDYRSRSGPTPCSPRW